MAFKINAVYAGDDQVELTHGLSGTKLLTDLPPDNGGKGRTFSPTDLAAASVAPNALIDVALSQYHSGGFSTYGIALRLGRIQSPDAAIARGTSA